LRPEWYHRDDDRGIIKVIMTGSASDDVSWQEHIRTKPRRRVLGDRMKDPADPLKIAIVRDMWLTGFDAPSLHTMYIDKPMRSHGLMQAIARVNRVFKDKKGGLVVDYLGIADELKKALSEYTESGGRGKTVFDKEEAVAEMLEKAIKKYQNKSIETAQIIEELIELAKEMREARLRGEKLNLNEEELAFYDALEVNDSAVKVLGDEKLVIIARELVDTVRKNVTIDWTLKERFQAKLICKDLAEV
jgi:type I site-specific restriction-modification system R (restriction) subunit